MAVQALPLLAAAGAALVLSGGKKKRKGPKSGQKCDPNQSAPRGFLCEDGFLREEAVEESELDELSKEDSGDFEMEEDDVGLTEGEEAGDEAEAESEPEPEPDAQKTCEEFMAAVHVAQAEPGELPINAVAVEESVLPAMRATVSTLIEQLGAPLDEEAVGPALVVDGLRALIPVCKWKYNADEDEFTYDGGRGIESEVAKEVLFGLITISLKVIEEANAPKAQTATFQAQG
ncbi:MAG: hypothetical protein ACYTBS_18955 [Planctomycetota bacterium]|jgi:hypothetical protein